VRGEEDGGGGEEERETKIAATDSREAAKGGRGRGRGRGEKGFWMVHRQALAQVPLPAHPAARLSSGLPLLRAPREAGVMQDATTFLP
jgi:hypothetical protein